MMHFEEDFLLIDKDDVEERGREESVRGRRNRRWRRRPFRSTAVARDDEAMVI